jgi:hypothetical protein
MFARRIAALSLPIFGLACNLGADIAQQDAQELVDTVNDSASFVPEIAAEFEAAQIAAIAAPDANTIAGELATRIAANHACATATATANVVTVDWACTIGAGAQSTNIAGQTTIDVSVVDQTVTFAGSTPALTVGLANVNSATTLVVDLGATTATIDRDVVATRGDDVLTVSLNGSADFVNNGGLRTVTIDATREVEFNQFERTHVWSGVVFQEGVRLPLAGEIEVEGARGGSLNAVFSTEGDESRVEVTVVGRRGNERFFSFVIDTANDDEVIPE